MYPMLKAVVPCTQSSRCSFPGVLCTLSFAVHFLHLSRPSPDPNPYAVVFVDLFEPPSFAVIDVTVIFPHGLSLPRFRSSSIVVVTLLLLFSSFWSLRFFVTSILSLRLSSICPMMSYSFTISPHRQIFASASLPSPSSIVSSISLCCLDYGFGIYVVISGSQEFAPKEGCTVTNLGLLP